MDTGPTDLAPTAPGIASRVGTLEQLTSMYRPAGIAATKSFDTIDDSIVAFLARCPFVVLATADGQGSVDASPRGGPPGFVQVIDERHVALPDLNGNNRLDSLRNVVVHPWAGLLFVVPGQDETMRINGPAYLTTDADVLAGFTAELRTPKLALVVETAEIYGHCAKAFMRSHLWEPDTWAGLADAPDLAAVYADRFQIGEADLRSALDTAYADELAQD